MLFCSVGFIFYFVGTYRKGVVFSIDTIVIGFDLITDFELSDLFIFTKILTPSQTLSLYNMSDLPCMFFHLL